MHESLILKKTFLSLNNSIQQDKHTDVLILHVIPHETIYRFS